MGVALPLALMLSPTLRNRGSVQIAVSLLVMLALFIARYGFIIGGQMVAPFKGEWVGELIRYRPSIAEWTLLLMAIFLAIAVNAFGEKAMNLDAEPRAEA